jgi:hypothetical protein
MSLQHFENFRAFYPYYLGEHRNTVCRRLHVAGSVLVLAVLAAVLATRQWWGLVLMPVTGYGFAWIGHFFFEKNRPATFKHPVYSLMGDWVMLADVFRGRVRL